jgi:hypothetical protein
MDVSAPEYEELITTQYAMRNEKAFADYVELRLHGVHSHTAFRRIFPATWINRNEGTAWMALAVAVDYNPWVTARLRDRIAETEAKDLWNPKIAVHELVSLTRDPFAKDTSRLGAMKELNVLLNITIVDENGKTRAGRRFEDFYAANGEANAATPVPAA